VDGDDFYIDLLFFNWAQSRFVVIELKIGPFQPEHAGKLGFYVTWVDANLRQPDRHSPTIGILLCAGRNDSLVRYTLAGSTAPLAVANYTYDTLPPSPPTPNSPTPPTPPSTSSPPTRTPSRAPGWATSPTRRPQPNQKRRPYKAP